MRNATGVDTSMLMVILTLVTLSITFSLAVHASAAHFTVAQYKTIFLPRLVAYLIVLWIMCCAAVYHFHKEVKNYKR